MTLQLMKAQNLARMESHLAGASFAAGSFVCTWHCQLSKLHAVCWARACDLKECHNSVHHAVSKHPSISYKPCEQTVRIAEIAACAQGHRHNLDELL